MLISWDYHDVDGAIVAQVEPEKLAVSFHNSVKVKEIYVRDGQYVKVGDPLVRVERYDLMQEIYTKKNFLVNLETRLSNLEHGFVARLGALRAAYEQSIGEVEWEIGQLQFMMAAEQKRMVNLNQMQLLDTATLPYSEAGTRWKMFEERRTALRNEFDANTREQRLLFQTDTTVLRNDIRVLQGELALLESETIDLVRYATAEGTVGTIMVESDALVPPYSTLLSVYRTNPTTIRALINEHKEVLLKTGDQVYVESINREYRVVGEVIEVGSRFIEYPDRLRNFQGVVTYGRELFIRIPDENRFLSGEKVLVRIPSE